MIKVLKQIIKITGIGIGSFILLYLGVTFATKDISQLSCVLTYGEYKQKMTCTSHSESGCEKLDNKFICIGGLFDPKKEKEYKYYPIDEARKKEREQDERAYIIKYFCREIRGMFGDQCETDEDCMTKGCNGEICANKESKVPATACVSKPCFETGGFITCGCANGVCHWIADDETIVR